MVELHNWESFHWFLAVSTAKNSLFAELSLHVMQNILCWRRNTVGETARQVEKALSKWANESHLATRSSVSESALLRACKQEAIKKCLKMIQPVSSKTQHWLWVAASSGWQESPTQDGSHKSSSRSQLTAQVQRFAGNRLRVRVTLGGWILTTV